MANFLSSFAPHDHRQTIHCPNCGSHALRRHYWLDQEMMTETACPVCDYLLVSSQLTGKVMDSYVVFVKRSSV